jgi:hypothetical protein
VDMIAFYRSASIIKNEKLVTNRTLLVANHASKGCVTRRLSFDLAG